MKKILISAAALIAILVASSEAKPYFELLDHKHPITGIGFLISPMDPDKNSAVTDLALILHKKESGSIIPEQWQDLIPPVDWVPLQIGFGGSVTGNAVGTLGSSVNIAPTVANLLLQATSGKEWPWAKATAAALSGEGKFQVRLGVVFAGELVKDGDFQSLRGMFPGRGIVDIAANSARLNFGPAWKF